MPQHPPSTPATPGTAQGGPRYIEFGDRADHAARRPERALRREGAKDIRRQKIVIGMLNDVGCGRLLKVLWHDGIGLSLYAKRLEKGRFVWPSPADGSVAISAAQLAYMLDGIDWRNPRHTFRPERAG